MKKNILITIVVSAVIIFSGLFFWIKSGIKEEAKEQNETQVASQLPANLPVNSPSQKPVAVSAEETAKDSVVRVQDVNNENQIQNAYKKYINQDLNAFPSYLKTGISQDYPINDENGKMASLQMFLSSIDAQINPQIKQMISSKYYGMFYCINIQKQKEFGITFDAGYGDSKDLKIEGLEAKANMKKWEPFMLKDLHNILFPSNQLSEAELGQTVSFQDGEFRYATVNVSGEKNSINYTVETHEDSSVNRIYITTSQACLRKALDNLFDY
ncbi:MAG TPA: hypothetical protein VK254_04060 [Candidatus Bathyarchaeia archaeon]|nr:hypothetical protein [Candidatus Bathyarchaeia archaeon]